MGDYYEVCLRGTISSISELDKAIIEYWFNNQELPMTLPNHELFNTDDWDSLFSYGTFYTYPERVIQYKNDEFGICVFANFSIKNSYNTVNLIKLLFDYFGKLVKDEFLGYYRFEDDSYATVINKYLGEVKITGDTINDIFK